MRYPQLFATLAIEDKLKSGIKKGIIWHTQGSGKTALAYYNVFISGIITRSIIILPNSILSTASTWRHRLKRVRSRMKVEMVIKKILSK
jgi:hypothetical protein